MKSRVIAILKLGQRKMIRKVFLQQNCWAPPIISLRNFSITGSGTLYWREFPSSMIFQINLKTSVVFVDLSAADATVWRHGLLNKLYKSVPCKQTLQHIDNMLTGRVFRAQQVTKRVPHQRSMADCLRGLSWLHYCSTTIYPICPKLDLESSAMRSTGCQQRNTTFLKKRKLSCLQTWEHISVNGD